MRLLHGLAKIHATFDDLNLVSRAGLVPVMALAQRAGLGDLAAEHVRIGRPCGVNAHLKIPCLAAGMIAGADSIDDMGLLSQVQALDWSQPVLPMMPGMPERRTHDYARHGVTSLFAAFNIADGTVISELHRRHRHQEFSKFLKRIDKNVPPGLDVHLVCDNHGTHKTPAIQDWLARHPRFHVHFTPTGSSWINQVERWFGYLTDKKIRRGVHKSVLRGSKTRPLALTWAFTRLADIRG
jgi:DDE superfamily endonuclease